MELTKIITRSPYTPYSIYSRGIYLNLRNTEFVLLGLQICTAARKLNRTHQMMHMVRVANMEGAKKESNPKGPRTQIIGF